MSATEFWVAISYRILGFFAGPLFIMIGAGNIFGKNMSPAIAMAMLFLIVAFLVWWTIMFVRAWKQLSQIRRDTRPDRPR